MIETPAFLLFLAGALALNFTPGPDMAFTLATSARGGARAGFAAATGIGVGALVWAALTAGGLAALLAASDDALTAVRIVGGAYLLYLAAKTFNNRREMAVSDGSARTGSAFRTGLITNLFNPKVGLFYVAFLPTFTDPTGGAVWLQILILGAVFSFTGFVVLAMVAAAAGALRNRLFRSQRFVVGVNTVASGIFGALGLHLLLVRHS